MPPEKDMRITIAYLGGSRAHTGVAREQVALAAGATVGDIKALVAKRHPPLAPFLDTVRWARNFEFAESDEALADGDEVGVLPPVAGGVDATRLTTDALMPQQVLQRVWGPHIGATVLFVGTVRNTSKEKQVERLRYEAYLPMAQRQLERIAKQCERDHQGAQVAIDHRYGDLDIGDISVVIAAGAPHRQTAFDACHQAIEQIKRDVPIWKHESTTDGEVWVNFGGG